MLEMVSRHRLKTLIGGKNALSGPVFTGVVVILLLFSVNYIWVISGQSLLTTMIAAAWVVVLPIAVLLATRVMGGRDGWVRPHPAIVVSGLVLASLVRSCATVLYVNWHSSGQGLDPYPIRQILSALILTVAFGVFMAALAQIALERAEAQSNLLADQERLIRLIETADAELIRTENELRTRAHSILLPAVDEIRDLILGELSESEARLLAQRIDVAVSQVVRPLSRELAFHPLMESEQIITSVPVSVNLLKDRIDISSSIRPGWLMFAFWGVLPPVGILIGLNLWVFERSFLLALISLPVIWAIKVLVPRRMRDMPMAQGLGVLLIVYTTLNVAFEFVVVNGRRPDNGSGFLLNLGPTPIVVRVILAMFVSILAMLNVRRQRIRSSLLETNTAIEKLVSRIKCETWV